MDSKPTGAGISHSALSTDPASLFLFVLADCLWLLTHMHSSTDSLAL